MKKPAVATAAAKLCRTCAKPGCRNTCSVCDQARYCSTACQTQDWPAHKLDCYNTVSECNRVVHRLIYGSRDWLALDETKCNVHVIYLDTLTKIRAAQQGEFEAFGYGEAHPIESPKDCNKLDWDTIYPLSMINYDLKKHTVINLQVKCAASTNKWYRFAFALGKRSAKDDPMTMIMSESGSAFFQVDPKYHKKTAAPITISYCRNDE